jgi:hypothetical protein
MASIRPYVSVLLYATIVALGSWSSAQAHKDLANSVVPGKSVGPLHLGDSREHAEQLFPFKKDMDQEWTASNSECGTTFLWVDPRERYGGNVFVHVRDGVVFQIDSATKRFHTATGITRGASPSEVRKVFPSLQAYILSKGTSEAYGMRPLVYWTDKAAGIAFAFSFSRHEKSWALDHTVVFRPGAEICPEPEALSPSDKKQLPAFSFDYEQ